MNSVIKHHRPDLFEQYITILVWINDLQDWQLMKTVQLWFMERNIGESPSEK